MNLNATILGQAITFILFVLSCMKYIWSPLMAAIEKRQEEITDDPVSAERAHKDPDLVKASATDQLKEAKVEAQIVIEQANRRRPQILDEAKTEAEQERTKIVAWAQAEIEAERKHACEEPRKQVAILTVTDAEKTIGRSVGKAVNSDIVDKLVAELQGGRGQCLNLLWQLAPMPKQLLTSPSNTKVQNAGRACWRLPPG